MSRSIWSWRARHALSLSCAILSILTASLVSGGCSGEKAADVARAPAPDFNLERVGGGRMALSELRGKLVLLDFWATWCVPCVKAIPELNAIQAQFKDRGVAVVGLAVDDLEAPELAAWMTRRGVEYPVARTDLDLAGRYGASEFPQHVLIAPDGSILESLEPGYHSRDELAERIEKALK